MSISRLFKHAHAIASATLVRLLALDHSSLSFPRTKRLNRHRLRSEDVPLEQLDDRLCGIAELAAAASRSKPRNCIGKLVTLFKAPGRLPGRWLRRQTEREDDEPGWPPAICMPQCSGTPDSDSRQLADATARRRADQAILVSVAA